MRDHVCKRRCTCYCSITAMEPDDDCPVHSGGEWPPRCDRCGKFMKWVNVNETLVEKIPLS